MLKPFINNQNKPEFKTKTEGLLKDYFFILQD